MAVVVNPGPAVKKGGIDPGPHAKGRVGRQLLPRDLRCFIGLEGVIDGRLLGQGAGVMKQDILKGARHAGEDGVGVLLGA